MKDKKVTRRASINWFSSKMEEILSENDYKGGWDHLHFKYLFDMMRLELDELLIAYHEIDYWKLLSEEDKNKLICECVDIANFAMMIADNVR